jgi:two-component system, LytTR family, sensor kinase
MKLAKLKVLYLWCFFISMPFITFALCYIMYGQRMFYEWKPWVYGFILIYIIGYISWRLHYQYDYFLQTKFPGVEQTRNRVSYKLLINIMIMSPSVLVILFVFSYFHIAGYYAKPEDITSMLMVGFSTNIIFETLYEAVYIIEKYKDTILEREMLVQMNLQQEFDNLKGKVNPHFLFNCFNTLSSLISENKELAEKFLDELSKVYRYLLRNNEDGMSTVESEMKFIHSYFQLMRTRHGQGINMNMRIDKKYYSYLVPSLSLQLLVENAVKHNVVSRQSPLSIEIFTTEGKQLVVNNNLNKKIQKEKSTRIGLQNIESKYKLINHDGFQVVDGEKNFMVVLPMIWKPKKTL